VTANRSPLRGSIEIRLAPPIPGVALRSTPGYHRSPLRGSKNGSLTRPRSPSEVRVSVVSPPRPYWPRAVTWAALFALAHGQAPAFYSNQHQYLLHGLAHAGLGHLDDDWLANTHDPTPVFSGLVAILYKLAGPFGLHALCFLLLGAYFEGVRRMVEALPGMPTTVAGRSLFLLLFLAVHACVLRVASAEWTGVDWPWYLQAGLAAQYLLGPGLQPSVFGVLLILSLAAYAHHRPVTAAGLAAGAAVMHSTYLLPAGLLVLGYLVSLTWHGLPRAALVSGLFALAIVSPVLAYDLQMFVRDDADLLPAAQYILATIRIPHHTQVGAWLDPVAWVQICIMVAGLVALRRTRLFLPLAVPTVIATILTAIQVLTKSDALALLFPWRFSVVLMPVAVAVLLAKAVALLAARGTVSKWPARSASGEDAGPTPRHFGWTGRA
jgi:hypothetical protein